ncbi:MAG: hypothetical protein EOP53_21265 [Sphingobacteriales bacterium]|nr:MAG: hypothetical protein EOP53_21265 [Sphingobacteriales bacterium]
MNIINIDKIFDEARGRKPILEMEEIEQLLQDKNKVKRAYDNWKNISLLALILLFGGGISYYYLTSNAEKSTEKLSTNNIVVTEDKNLAFQQKDGANPIQNTAQETLTENKNIVSNSISKNKVNQPENNEDPATKSENNAAGNTNLNNENQKPAITFFEKTLNEKRTAFTLNGWELVSKVPSQFGYGLDKDEVFSGNASAYINSRKSNYNSAWLTQEISAAPYAGKRLKMTAMVKSENAGKKAWAGIFMNIKGNDFKKAGFDNLFDKNVSGQSDWVACELVMDVPAESKKITFGLYKVYGGNAWIDNINFEVVNDEVPLHFKTQTEAQDTSLIQPDLSSRLLNIIVEKPENVGFENSKNELPEDWHIGEEKQYFRAVADDKNAHGGKYAAMLQSTGYVAKDWNTLMQYCKAGNYLNKRLKLTAWVRTEDLKEYASFVFRVDGFIVSPQQEKIKEITFTGNNNWRKVELVLNIPDGATHFSYGLLLQGKGKVWMDDISIDEVASDEKITNISSFKPPVNLDFEE